MKIKGLTEATLRDIATRHGFRMDNVRQIGNFTAFVLRMRDLTPSASDRKWMDKADTRVLTPAEDRRYREIAKKLQYRKLGSDMQRWTGAVCFHGHKAFMDGVFERNPDALIVTRMARYEGKEDFDRKWSGTGMESHGPAYQGTQYREACNCYGG
jgi:hypothetical protein